MSQLSNRRYFQDGVEYCWCNKHKGFQPCSEFTPRDTFHGYYYTCRACMMVYQKQLRDKKIRHKIEDGVEWCFCTQHEEFHPCSEFQKSNGGHGYQYNCRVITKLQNENRGIEFSRDYERVYAMEMLKKLGYDTDSEIPIYKQFEKKHQL